MRYLVKWMAYFMAPVLTASLLLCSCKKWLQEKPSSDINVPDSLEKMEAMLNNRNALNFTPGLNDISSDNLYLLPDFWRELNPIQHYAYYWESDIYNGDTAMTDYDLCSEQIKISNMILEGLKQMPVTDVTRERWNAVRGKALFFRSCAYFNLAQLFCKPYDAVTAKTDLGVPLRTTSSPNDPTFRSTVQETYDRITSELKAAVHLLPGIDIAYKNRPSKPGAYGMLARVFQAMNAHDQATRYADSCLGLYYKLLDYNSLDLSSAKPFLPTNPEVIFETSVSDKADALLTTYAKECLVDSSLYRQYHINDLRRDAFYSLPDAGLPYFKRSYIGSAFPFSGLAVDEILLIRAEGHARANDLSAALKDINDLLKTRWKQQTYIAFTASTSPAALNFILEERRKELPLRGLRWSDLRRLNREGRGIWLQRVLNNQVYQLPPNDRLYVLPFPPEVIKLTNMEQNPR